MQSDINAVPWSTLEHAYGPATDIPELLKKIEANDAKSVIKLANCIAHQGWATPTVSIAVIPFLFELVTTTTNGTKAKLIALLSDLACAGSHEHFMRQRMQGNIFRELIANKNDLVAIRNTIISNGHIIIEQLGDTNANVRAAAAQFMAVTSQVKKPLLQQLEKEKNKTTKADMLIALGWLIHSSDDQDVQILEKHLHDIDNTVRFGAVIGLAYSALLDDQLLPILYQVLSSDPVKQSTWCNGHYYEIGTSILIQRGQESKDSSLLLNAFSHIPRPNQFTIVANLLRDNFKREMKSMVKPPKVERLSELQKNILGLIVESGIGGNVSFFLGELGLPDSPPGVSLYLGIPLPIELIDSQSVSFNGMTGTLRDIINQQCTASKPENVSEEQVKLLAEAIASKTAIHQFMDVAFSISKIFKPETHLLVFYFLLAGSNSIERELSTKIDELLEEGGTQFYYYESPYKKGNFLCGGDQFLLILYWTALHHINPNHPVPTKIERWPMQSEARSLKYAYHFFGLRIYAGYKASPRFRDAYIVCKSVWRDMTLRTHDLKEYGWDESQF